MNNDFSSNTYDKNDDFIDITHDLDKHYIDTIEILRQTVEAKDPYTRGHSDRVSAYSVLLGKKLALPKKDLMTLKIGGNEKVAQVLEVSSEEVDLTKFDWKAFEIVN